MAVILTTHDINGLAAHLPRIACVNRELIAIGTPREVLTPDVLERTYGAPMEVLEHGGMLLVTDSRLESA
jgi:ABC-type Mn2+/Zn2+ transport system ATPase subunit